MDNDLYKNISGNIPSCTIAVDPNGRYLLLDSDPKISGIYTVGIIWDIDKNTGYPGFQNIRDKSNRIRWISSDSLSKFYAISDANNVLTMVRYALCNNCVIQETFSHAFDSMGEVFPNNTCKYHDKPHMRRLCKSGTTGLEVEPFDGDPNCQTIDWSVYNGFIGADGKIYLFGENDVIAFPEEAYQKAGQPVTFEKTPYNKIINCSEASAGRDKVFGSK